MKPSVVWIVCADNGIVMLVNEQERIEEIRRIELTGAVPLEDQIFLHSREVLAPAAARLVYGESLEALGPPLEEIRG